VLVRHTLRSGRSVRHAGHVIIIGDVNPGAEVVAGGDIVVWGRLRGVAHAGAPGSSTEGDNGAVVCALDLSPTQLRIAEHIATSPARKGEPKPEMARIKNGQIVAERWSAKGKAE
jgi:septum site-determining protein MinC